ncbi:hybrid sensor histidine kinase/response regulator [Methyloferula stellata]|uniref:hybrid sensor histidine kinase/response regulator n=1 Tax=Methyloferula stellata TaxID=876270 RepID=UPI0003723303|nr:hybrid sensor histidine kinase/response regulator [Methyloferula stellata]
MPIGSEPERIDGRPLAVRPRRILLLAGVVVVLALCAATALVIWQLRTQEIRAAKRELITLDVLLVEETERALQSVDLVLRNLQEKIAADGVTTVEDYVRTQSGQETHELLRSKITGIPQIQAVALIGADGHLINSSRDDLNPAINVSGRDYFEAMRGAPADAPFLADLAPTRGAQTWSMFLVRRVSAPDGTFLGLIRGSIDVGYFENLYKALEIGDGAAVALWREDGTLLARYPPVVGGARSFRSNVIAGRPHLGVPQTYSVEHSSGDGLARLFATITAKQFPVVVTVGQTFDEILKDWRHVATLIVASAILCITAVILSLWLLARQFAAYEALHIAMQQRGAAEAARIEVEEQLRQAQKLEAIGQLTGGIAHDFNNLLTAVMGNLELLIKHIGSADPRLPRWAKSAFEAAKRGAMLTQHLLAFSRRQPLDPKPTDIVQLLDSMLELLCRTLGENIEIKTMVADGLWRAFVDVNQLDNAILNIAINARDAMEGKGRLLIEAHNVVVDAETSAQLDIESGGYVLVSISDTGKGIAKHVLDRVFEPFFTTKPIGQGTGLGLSQVYGFLKQTGGKAALESELGHGTTVRIYLPRAVADEPAVLRPASLAEKTKADAGSVILVVEDEDDVRAYMVEILIDLGHAVREARNATEALDILRRDQTIILLLTDIGLPGLNGRELAKQALILRPDLKTLFASGYARQAIMHNDRLDEGVELLVKPFTHEELAQKVRLVL